MLPVLLRGLFCFQPEPQPDNDEHEAQVAAINEQIKKIKDDIEVLRSKIDEANEARRGKGVSILHYITVVDMPVVDMTEHENNPVLLRVAFLFCSLFLSDQDKTAASHICCLD